MQCFCNYVTSIFGVQIINSTVYVLLSSVNIEFVLSWQGALPSPERTGKMHGHPNSSRFQRMFIYFFLKILFICSERGREGEKHQCVRDVKRLPLSLP